MEDALYKHSFKVQERALTSLSVYNTGLQRCEPDYCWGPGVRDHYLIHYVTAGHGEYTTCGRTHALAAGDMFLARPEETITYRADTRDPWAYCWVGFHGLDADTLISQTDFADGRLMLRFDSDAPRALLMDIYESRGSGPVDGARMTGRLYLFLAWLIENAKSEPRHKRQAGVEHVRRACAFIAGNFASPITVEDVAAHVGVCRSRLYRAFEAHMDMSPTQYLVRFRMRQACLLLKKGDLSVKAVAFSVGFEDPLYFSRRFREIIGVSPSEYTNNT